MFFIFTENQTKYTGTNQFQKPKEQNTFDDINAVCTQNEKQMIIKQGRALPCQHINLQEIFVYP